MRPGALLCALLALASGAAEAAADAARFAVVIGNNRSERSDTRDLRYADDDAVAMHELLGEAGVKSSLFVSLDAESRRLKPGLARAGRPRWSALSVRLAEIEEEIRAAKRSGAETELLVFYSGHGDVAHGEGYVELEDARLTRSLLRDAILERTAADQVHLVVDACRSYFLAFEKGAGGRRRPAEPLAPRARARTGYILSTSSDRDSHEWEAFQGGIFSHEVRSALRGAADADRDGAVTYAELGAFLTVANRGVVNSRFRPDFVVRPPAHLSDELLRWEGDRAALLLDLPGQGHMVVEGPAGERVLDVNPANGAELLVRLPDERPLFVRRADGDREFAISGRGRAALLRLSQLTAGGVRVASKGAIHLAFTQLFSAPFGAADVARYRAHARRDASAGPSGIEVELSAQPGRGGPGRTIAGVVAVSAGAVGLGLVGWAVERSLAAHDTEEQARRQELNGTVENLRLAAGLTLGVAAGAALTYWLLGDGSEPGRLAIGPAASRDGSYGIVFARSW